MALLSYSGVISAENNISEHMPHFIINYILLLIKLISLVINSIKKLNLTDPHL